MKSLYLKANNVKIKFIAHIGKTAENDNKTNLKISKLKNISFKNINTINTPGESTNDKNINKVLQVNMGILIISFKSNFTTYNFFTLIISSFITLSRC